MDVFNEHRLGFMHGHIAYNGMVTFVEETREHLDDTSIELRLNQSKILDQIFV